MPSTETADLTRLDRRLVLSGLLFGCGIAGAVIDLFIFHLGLQWHHFYDLSTTRVALTSDGFFHAVTWLLTVWGLFMLTDVRRRIAVPWGRWAGAVVAGVGFFQLFDGVVNHKVLRIHQVRYGVDLFLYDLVWIGSAILLLVAGVVVLWMTRKRRG
ncbi:DUF2243 domain-containing protein [Corynebacterium halotolerans]|uniref:DUF2243 domain-containing protein n=1 Tax=Corynebacterium halotolerans YIM 70093 = DSM 44683 TaxID=1121362 RepID=M1NSN0_9CORY|nr:DUF2243 domain-containing protein [Corynebacterium halotolerans]AGF72462.1 hypothetical protein A605_07300 [Corynebacterium halotolerans YIM 70093 = DSM 44683]